MKKYFDIQKEFQKKLYNIDKIPEEERVKWSKEFILSAHKELSEILDCLNWKLHRKEDTLFSRSNLGEEIIDVFKYIVNICLVWKINPKDFDKFFDDKTAVVIQRHKQEFMEARKDEKVCAIDLDDVLNEWEKFYVKTFNKKNHTKYHSDKEIREDVNTLKYRAFKNWWRECGIKRNIPVKEGAALLTKFLKRKGYRIVIISSRPYKEYSRIFSDTIYWLKKNKITYDDLYFEENKHLKILKYFPKLSFMIEDKLKFATQTAKEGYDVILLRDKKYEKEGGDIGQEHGIVVVHSLNEVKKFIK